MASVIAQLLATKRNLRLNKKKPIPCNKSNCTLGPYDDNFSEEKHNKYFRNRSEFLNKPKNKNNLPRKYFKCNAFPNRPDFKRKEMIQNIAKGRLDCTYT